MSALVRLPNPVLVPMAASVAPCQPPCRPAAQHNVGRQELESERMSEPWVTIVPIYNLWRLPDGLLLPYEFNDRTSLGLLPEWLLAKESDDTVDLLRPRLREVLNDNIHYCVTVEYQADALGSSDPHWSGDKPRAIQDGAFEDARNVFLSFWLVRPTSIHFREVAHVANGESGRVVRQIAKYDPQCPLPGYVDDAYETKDLERIRSLTRALDRLPINGSLRTAVHATMRAQTEREWTLRFLILWLVIENLFGPEDAREITFRLSQRVALFLSSDTGAARQLFSQVKVSYAWRSKLVHGLRLAKLTEAESTTLIVQLESMVRQSLVAILSDDVLMTTFDGKSREHYLDDLVFK